MPRVLLANCYPPSFVGADALLTDETLVAAAAPSGLRVLSGEAHVDEALAHRTSIEMTRAALSWFRIGEHDPSIVEGISAGDLCAAEVTGSVLMPAARAVLSTVAALDRGPQPSTLAVVAPAGEGRYARLEALATDAALAAARSRLGRSLAVERISSGDPRNASLREKYAVVRDPEYLSPSGASGARQSAKRSLAVAVANAHGRLRRRGREALLVLEYNPTQAFARAYGARRTRRWGLVCWPQRPRDLLAIARAGDAAILPLAPDLSRQPNTGVADRLRDHAGELEGHSLHVAGVELWPIVRERLFETASRYACYAAALVKPLAGELDRRAVRAVLVPFDLPAQARLIVRVAQMRGIPTFVTNDGFKADEIQQEGMTADVALAWSQAMRDRYFARRPSPATVTGNPRLGRLERVGSGRGERGRQTERGRSTLRGKRGRKRTCLAAHRGRDRMRSRVPTRVLVGGHTFSPSDLNCRRSDSERFLEQVLEGIATSLPRIASGVLVKLHPADPEDRYRAIARRHSQLRVDLRRPGDVVELFSDFDLYVTTYSTSLLEAVAVGMPIVYYQVNQQRMGPPFSHDEFLAGRTARTPVELAALLADEDALASAPPAGWVEHYLGPQADAVDRILAAIERRPAP